MAKGPKKNAADAAQAGSKLAELKKRILFLLGALIVFRTGTFIPVPGVDPAALATFFDQQAGNMLALVNLFSGGALSRFGIFALGIMPYISASIIMQMASHLVEPLQQLRKEGESGRRKSRNIPVTARSDWQVSSRLPQRHGCKVRQALSFPRGRHS